MRPLIHVSRQSCPAWRSTHSAETRSLECCHGGSVQRIFCARSCAIHDEIQRLLLGMSDADIDQIYERARRRISYFRDAPFRLLTDGSNMAGEIWSDRPIEMSFQEGPLDEFHCCFMATEESGQSIRYSSECLAAHNDRASDERYGRGPHVLIMCLLCLLVLAPPLLGQSGRPIVDQR